MKETKKTVYEEAVFALCKLASVRWPLQLVGKKIAFIVNDSGAEVKIYDTINQVIVAHNPDGRGSAVICLNYVDYPDGNRRILEYKPDEKIWKYCAREDSRKDPKVEFIVFETKLFGLFTI